MKRIFLFTAYSLLLTIFGLSGVATAKEDIATVVALRGKASIERDKKEAAAKVKDSILLNDTVLTQEAARAKLLFIDDSVLSISEKSKVIIKEFVYSKDKGGKSIFNLIDGKMRSVVGKTEFEVHTPTAVAAARGTVILFEVGMIDGKIYTIIICLEGEVNIKSIDPGIGGIVALTPGMMVNIREREPLPAAPTSAPGGEVERLKKETDTARNEISMPEAADLGIGAGILIDVPHILQINQQPANKTPVTIDVVFP